MFQLIAIDGYAGAGKDTCANVLISRGFTKVSFGDALREACCYAFKLPLNIFLDRNTKDSKLDTPLKLTESALLDFLKYIKYYDLATILKCLKHVNTTFNTPREILIYMGTEIARKEIKETIWLEKYLEKIQGLSHVVTPDCRFDNEREFIKSMGGKVVWVEKPDLRIINHVSETQKWPLDKYDVVVYNTSTESEMTNSFGMWYSSINNYSRWLT